MNYPYDIVSIVRKKTFSVAARFTRRTDDNPLEIFDSTCSRFVFTLIQDKIATTCNIHIEDLEEITQNTNLAKAADFEYRRKSQNTVCQGNKSPAFTTRFTTGNLKGKTPIEVLLENGEEGTRNPGLFIEKDRRLNTRKPELMTSNVLETVSH